MDAELIPVSIDSIRVSLVTPHRIVVLKDDNERFLPIWIGPFEAESITIALQEVEVARPQTHDLLKNILQSLNARLTRVEVLSLREDVFFGNLVIEVNGRTLNVDSRPSDALALAVRAHVPILVSKEVMDSVGIIPEAEGQETDAAPSSPSLPKASSETPGTPGASGAEQGEERPVDGTRRPRAGFLVPVRQGLLPVPHQLLQGLGLFLLAEPLGVAG